MNLTLVCHRGPGWASRSCEHYYGRLHLTLNSKLVLVLTTISTWAGFLSVAARVDQSCEHWGKDQHALGRGLFQG